jgi:hypothetical protein
MPVRDRPAQGIGEGHRHAEDSVGELDPLIAIDRFRKEPNATFREHPPQRRYGNAQTRRSRDGAERDIERARTFDPRALE